MNDPHGTDGCTVVLTEQYDPEGDEPLLVRIVRLVSVATDSRITELEPLGRRVDTDALEVLFRPEHFRDPTVSIFASIPYEGYLVTIDTDGTIRLLDRDQ